MPLYEYKCEKCGDTFEVIQKFSETPLSVHHGCGGAVERLLSASTFRLKGAGWYVTDYGRKGSGSNGGEKKDAAKPDAKTDPAPAKTDSAAKSDK